LTAGDDVAIIRGFSRDHRVIGFWKADLSLSGRHEKRSCQAVDIYHHFPVHYHFNGLCRQYYPITEYLKPK